MRFLAAALFGVIALYCGSTASAEVTEEEGVLVLDESNFDGVLAENKLILVEFYAPWCGHCKKLAPEWAKAAKTLKAQNLPLAKVDATENQALAERFGIQGYPTIRLFREGKPSDYTGGRTADEIVSWFTKKSGPVYVTLNTVDELNAFLAKHELNVVGAFESLESDVASKFRAVAADSEVVTFGLTADSAVRGALGVSGDVLVLHKPFDEKKHELAVSSETTENDIRIFVTSMSLPLVHEFTPSTAQRIFSTPIRVHYLFFTDASQEHHEAALSTFRAVASDLRGKALVVNIPHTEQRIIDYFGVTSYPSVYLVSLVENGMDKYHFNQEITVENVRNFANEFFAGNLKPHLKSEEPAAEDLTGAVKVVKGTSFSDIVLNNDKHVFVEFYAPWCGHCKKLEPIWTELGEKLAANDNIVIAKMDATANEVKVPGVSVQGFPTLYFFKASDKANPVKYDGERTLEGFSSFLNEHTGVSVASDESSLASEL